MVSWSSGYVPGPWTVDHMVRRFDSRRGTICHLSRHECTPATFHRGDEWDTWQDANVNVVALSFCALVK